MQKITPFLWFNGNLGEALEFYTATFKNSKVIEAHRSGNKVMSATFQLEGGTYLAFDGGPMFQFSPAISLFVSCETQEEVDKYWDRLSTGGETQQCGWLKDKFGLSWQIIPSTLGQMLYDKDQAKAGRVMQAMLKMKKIIIKDLKAAYDGK